MATLTIDFTASQTNRLQHAVGVRRGLGRDATNAEVKQYVIDELRAMVLGVERDEATAALTSTAFDPT